MKKSMRKRKSALMCLVLCMAVALCSCVMLCCGKHERNEERALQNEASLSAPSLVMQDSLKSAYYTGDVINVPAAKINYNGANYDAQSNTLVYPDGNARTGSSYVLDVSGKYTLTYYASANGERISASTEFTASNEAYSAINGAQYEFINDLTRLKGPDDGGLSVTLTDGATFTYAQPIDVSGSNTQVPIIELFPYNRSTVMGYDYPVGGDPVRVIKEECYVQARQIFVRLTDCYNENNYIEVCLDWNYSDPTNFPTRMSMTYSAGPAGQNRTALVPNPSGAPSKWYANMEFEGDPYLLITNAGYGRDSSYDNDNPTVSIYYDNKTKQIYIKDKQFRIITDLDHPDVYTANRPIMINGAERFTGTPFGGFETGEVYLSVFAKEFRSNALQFEIAEIYGVKGSELAAARTHDDVPPVIKVDKADETKEEIYIALDEPFEIFSATASDLNGIKEFTTSVWYGYGTTDATYVGQENGKFTPCRTGTYTIKYSAIDGFGNPETKLVELVCVKTESGKAIDFSATKLENVPAGAVQTITYSATGLNGHVDVEAYATFDGTDAKVRLNKNGDRFEFLPERIGKYTLVFEYYDRVMSGTYSYELNSVTSNNVLISDPTLPLFFIKGTTYTLELPNATDFASGAENVHTPEVYVVEDGGEEKQINPAAYKVEASQTVELIYKYGGAEKRCGAVDVIDTGFGNSLDIGKYFYGDFSYEKSRSAIEYTSNVTSGENYITFIKEISLSEFSLSFNIPANGGNFSALKFMIADYYDRESAYVYTFTPNGSNTLVKAEKDGAEIASTIVAREFASDNATMDIRYTSKGEIEVVDSSLGAVEFSSDKIIIAFVLEGINGAAKINIRRVNNQVISRATSDVYGAIITTKSPTGSLVKGGSIKIYPATVTDVLTPFVLSDFKFSVLDGSNSYMKSKDGVTLDGSCDPTREYEIEFPEYGKYQLEYNYTDQAGNRANKTVILEITDREAPVITLNDGYNERTLIRAKVGYTLDFIGCTVSDNETAAENLSVFISVLMPNFELERPTDNKIQLTMKGEYRIYYNCTDEAGNYSSRYYTVIAE